jgi:hypothetical protein
LTLTQPAFSLGSGRSQHLSQIFCKAFDLLLSVAAHTFCHQSSKGGILPSVGKYQDDGFRLPLTAAMERRTIATPSAQLIHR